MSKQESKVVEQEKVTVPYNLTFDCSPFFLLYSIP